ncbi:MAG: UvrY/SirA/GacA family response regulator transcription factor [Pseudomonadota bacterium]|nr:UvrY/SirA/GacA family response regulator transcription factor [Pseudomonadota bacterium]
MIKVLLVDDHDLVRAGIRRLMEDHSAREGIEVVAEASSGEEAVDQLREHSPDVVLLDVNMPGIGGLEAARRMLRVDPQVRIIALTVYEEGPLLKRLIDAGAVGYLTKGCDVGEMVKAIRRVSRGERYIASDIAQRLALGMLPGAESSPLEALSDREMQILLMLTQGQKPQAISKQLHLSPKTVSTYKTRLQEKLNVHSDVELIRLAMQYGMLDKSLTD